MSALERLWTRVDKEDGDGCWLWTGNLQYGGRYGGIKVAGRSMPVHQLAWEAENGPVPDGLELDHLCRVRRCVRPSHLEPVTHAENMRRGNGWAGQNARKTVCDRHGFVLVQTRRERICRECRREDNRAYRARRVVAA